MKKLFILSVVTFILAAEGNAQIGEASLKEEIKNGRNEESAIKKETRVKRRELKKLEGKEVSYQAKQAFYKDFGNIPVSQWERITNFDKAIFTKDGQVMAAYYDIEANLVGTTEHKTFADLPANAQKYIRKKYADYNIEDVIFFDDNELNETDMVMYNTQFDDADNYFIELTKGDKKIVLQINMSGAVSFFKQLR